MRGSWNQNEISSVRFQLLVLRQTSWWAVCFTFVNTKCSSVSLFIINGNDYVFFPCDLLSHGASILIPTVCQASALFVLSPHSCQSYLDKQPAEESLPHTSVSCQSDSLTGMLDYHLQLWAVHFLFLQVCLLDLQCSGHLWRPSVHSQVVCKCP